MKPTISGGELLTVAPVESKTFRHGQIVFTREGNGFRAHRISSVAAADKRIETKGDAGWFPESLSFADVLGRVMQSESDGKTMKLETRGSYWKAALKIRMRQFRKAIGVRVRRFATVAAFVLAGALAFSLSAAPAQAQADLALTSSVAPTTVVQGGTLTYTQTVTNNGPNTATTAVLYEQTPTNTTFASMTPPAGWTCATPAVGGTGQVTCTDSANLAVGAPANFTYVVTVNTGATPATGSTIYNWANTTSATVDPTPSNNSVNNSSLVEVTGDADLAVTAVASPTPVFVSSSLAYTIQVTNFGPSATTSGTLSDTLPTGVTFVSSSATPSSVTCSGTATVTCALGALASGASAVITINVTAPGTAQTLTNSPGITASAPTDPVTTNNSATVITVVQPLVCALPGNDGAVSPATGIVNAYYPPGAGVASVAAGATKVKLGGYSTSGLKKAIAVGDLLLIIQMQDASINSTNTGAYGDGVAGDPAYGSTALNSTGLFEFITAASALGTGGGTLTFTGAGAGGGLLNTYYASAATGTQGQATFQVIRVPQYTSATLSSGLVAQPWNGTTGGVLAIDVASQLTLGGTVALDGAGFRGGGGRILGGGTGAATDYVTLSTNNANGSKGEGIAATPAYIAPATITNTTTATATGAEGYPNGSYARGSSGNAGGGGTDTTPTSNNQNSGGGAGSNGGQGGNGGFAWQSAGYGGGFGAFPFPASTGAVVMGGGGGAGTTNDGSWYIASSGTGGADCGTTCTGIYSSGAPGGGIAIIHTGSVVGTGSITANGFTALSTENDGAGGGGAGGTIFVFANSGGLTGLTAQAIGGGGGDTWQTQAPGAFPGNRHGPGGGGGGGIIFLSSAAASSSAAGGAPGFSTTSNDAYGATPGSAGTVVTGLTITQTPGTQSGAYCATADLQVTDAGTPNPVLAGGTITYTQVVTNNGPLDAVNATFTEAIPAGTTFAGGSAPAGWTCTTPAVGAAGNILCTNPDVANAAVGTFTLMVTVAAGTPQGTQIIDTVNVASGTNDPNLTNNTATVSTIVSAATSADLVLTKTATPNPVTAGQKVTYTVTVVNNGPSAASTVSMTDATPTGTTFTSLAQTGAWTCTTPTVNTAGTITCSITSLPVNGTNVFTITVTVSAGTASGTVVSNTANVTSLTIDPNPSSNSATAAVTVATTGQYNLVTTSSASPNPVLAGNKVTFTQTVTNNGPSAAPLGTFTEALPANTSFVSFATPTGWTCTTPAVGATTGNINCTIASIAANSTAQFPLVVQVVAGTAPGTVISATAKAGPTTNDVSPTNNNSTATTIVAGPTQADVAILKTASPQPVNQGTNLTYTLQVTNNGPATATNVQVSDPLPSQVTFVSVFSTQGTCSPSAGTVSCSLGSISNGGLVIVTINTTATTFSSGTLVLNTATVSASTSDPNTTNNQSSTISTIQSPTAVEISNFHATAIPGGGVMLEWRTREEIRNLGFHLYRNDATGKHQITPSLIAGSALFVRGAQPQHAAKSYKWIDPQGTAQSSYTLEDVDLNGTHNPHGPVTPELSAAASSGSATPTPQAVLMTQFNAAYNTAAHAHSRMVPPANSIPGTPATTAEISSGTLNGLAAVKIGVRAEGWYSISGSQLAAAGFNTSENSRMLRLFAEGVEQPMLVNSKQIGSLGANDTIQFYGTGIDTPFSDTRIYWLVNGSQPGLRVAAAPVNSSAASAPADFLATALLEQRTTYFAALLNGENADNFFGASVTTEPVDQTLTISNLDPNSSIAPSIDVTLQGVTEGQPHSVSVELNGVSLGTVSFLGQAAATNTFALTNSQLVEGTNTVTLTALDGDNDVSLVQSIALHYGHTYAADSNWLDATAPGNSKLSIGGFTNGNVQVFDTTNPLAIAQIPGTVTASNAGFSIAITIPGAAGTQRLLVAFSSDQIAAPASLTAHAPDTALSGRQGVDEVIVTTQDFQSTLAPLLSLRSSQGRQVQVVTMDQLYDQFNFGERTPFALQDYLHQAQLTWRNRLQDVLLVGNASVDPRNYLGFGYFDFVPTRIIETAAFKTASDDWFSDFQQTGFATIPTGRLPVRTAAEATLVISKIVNYERGSNAGSWNSQAVFVADQNIGSDFSTATTTASTMLPSSVTATTILANNIETSTAQQQISAALNSGAVLVNYSGHGSEQQWSFSDLLDDTSVAGLTNGGRLPVFLLMDCLNGFFHDVYAESLSTSLMLAPNGGAVAVWASSGFTTQPPQAAMDQAMLTTLSQAPGTPIGRAMIKAKLGVTDPDVRRTWVLFGDPWMQIAFPGNTQASTTN